MWGGKLCKKTVTVSELGLCETDQVVSEGEDKVLPETFYLTLENEHTSKTAVGKEWYRVWESYTPTHHDRTRLCDDITTTGKVCRH